MKNNVIGNVQMMTDKLPASRFNLSNDFNTTLQFGVVYPTHCKYVHEGTNKVDSRETLFYLAPMPVRTFGRMKAKMYHQFVAFADLFPKLFPSMIAQTPYAAAAVGTINGGQLPFADARLISSFCLLGAKLNIWFGTTYDAQTEAGLPSDDSMPLDNTVYSLCEKDSQGNTTTEYSAITQKIYNGAGVITSSGVSYLSVLSNTASHRTTSWTDVTKNAFGAKVPTNTLLLNPFALFAPLGSEIASSDDDKREFLIPLGVDNIYGTTSDYNNNHQASYLAMKKQGYDLNTYGPGKNSDVVVTRYMIFTTTTSGVVTYHKVRLYFCFRLSDYGKRFKAFLEGNDYKPYFGTEYIPWALAPLAMTYKGYYDLFSINLFENFENSNLGKWCNQVDNGGYWSTFNNCDTFLRTCDFGSDIKDGLLAKLLYSFGDMFYTKEQDYLGSHIANTSVSPTPGNVIKVAYDVKLPSNITSSDSSQEHVYNDLQGQGHSYINSAIHGQLDAEFLKKAYLWVNRNTIAGQRIAQLLRAQGYGDYVDSTKSNFIGYEDVSLKVDSILASADTYQNANGSQLGQRAGVGIGYSDGSKVFKFENNEIGMVISFVTIVPESGYCQGSSPVNTRLIGKNDFYAPVNDGLGYESTTFESIVNTMKDGGKGFELSKTFGLVPQTSKFKVARNKMSGGFTLPSEADSFLPYTLDYYIPLDDLFLVNETQSQSYPYLKVANLVNPLQLEHIPTCGEPWRKVGKYAYIQNLNRIFSYIGSDIQLASSVVGNNWSEFVIRDADNFIMQMIDNDQSYAHMKPIEESFETDDEGKANTSMDKA